MSEVQTSISISEVVTKVTATSADAVSIDISTGTTNVDVRGIAIPVAVATDILFSPHGTVSATNLQTALEQLADQDFRTDTAPTAANTNLNQGDTWYDTDDEQLKLYRETSTGVFQWVPIFVGGPDDDSDSIDAGAF
jgi:hypothetical protein|tara:strand:- start:989 stop:1399 length:411 start_codon:yes stop_codon:yes gene_type:complete